MAEPHLGITSRPAGEYRVRLPSPPRMLMEGWPGSGLGVIDLSLVPQHIDVEAIQTFFDPENIETQLDWDYHKRREIQRILPYVSLGPFSAIKDSAQIQSHNITLVIALVHISSSTSAKPVPIAVRNATQHGIEARAFHTSTNQELIKLFPDAIQAIDEHMKRYPQGTVAVTCETGNDRSACIVAAYLMSIFCLDAPAAIQLVTYRRFCCAIDDDRKLILDTWGGILKAQRDTENGRALLDDNLLRPGSSVPKGRKRSRERHSADDVNEMETDNDSQKREFTPFYDE